MHRWALPVLASLGLLAAGAAGGYYYHQYRFVELSFLNLFAGRELSRARLDFVMMRSIADGKADDAYTILEGNLWTALLVTSEVDEHAEEVRTQRRELVKQLRTHYAKHPDRLEAAQKLFPDYRSLLEVPNEE